MLRQQPCHYHFIRMPETACPSLLPLNYLPVSLKKSGSDPDRLSGEERGVHLSHWFQFTMGQILLKHANNKRKVHPKMEFTLNRISEILASKVNIYKKTNILFKKEIWCRFKELLHRQ